MKKSSLFIITVASLLIATIHYFTNPYKHIQYEFSFKVGEIAEKDIIAPLDFQVHKSDVILNKERAKAANQVSPVYKVSDQLKFNALKNLDFIIQHFQNSSSNGVDEISRELKNNGFQLSRENIEFLFDSQNRKKVYEFLVNQLDAIFDIGIYPGNYQYEKIVLNRENVPKSYTMSRLYSISEAKQKLTDGMKTDRETDLMKELANIVLIANIVPDKDMTRILQQKAREDVPLTTEKILKNEKIISKNQKITQDEIMKLDSMIKAQAEKGNTRQKNDILLSALGVFVFSFILLSLFYLIIRIFFPSQFSSNSYLIVAVSGFLISIVLTVLIHDIFQISSFFVPLIFSVILVSLVFSPHIGLIFIFFNFIFVSHFLNWSFINPIILSVSAISGIIALKRMKRKVEYYPLTVYIFLSFLVLNFAISFIKFENLPLTLIHLAYGLISILISILALALLVPFVERKLNLATKQILLELLDFENPLLKKMSQTAPGTYHHSLIVGNLAETAAESIGANHLLARVGSYYHDIGKIKNPQFFIENNPDSTTLHDEMLANESSVLIKNHIAAGIALARQYTLPEQVIDIIRQHHGRDQIRFFYNKAKENNLEIDESQFHYDGPKPASKEAAIVMISDIIESTTKSYDNLSQELLEKIYNDTIFRLLRVGQLSEAPLSMKELETIKQYMLPIIMGVYRRRLEYPET